jgi:hypothetical protein
MKFKIDDIVICKKDFKHDFLNIKKGQRFKCLGYHSIIIHGIFQKKMFMRDIEINNLTINLFAHDECYFDNIKDIRKLKIQKLNKLNN